MGLWDWIGDLTRRRDVPITDPNAPAPQPGILAPQSGGSSPLGFLGDAITGYGGSVLGDQKASPAAKAWAALSNIGIAAAAGFGSPGALLDISRRGQVDPQEQQLRALQIENERMKMDTAKRQRDAYAQIGQGGQGGQGAAGGFDPRNPEHRAQFMRVAVASGDPDMMAKATQLESTFGKIDKPESPLGKLQLDQYNSRYSGNDPGSPADQKYESLMAAEAIPKAPPMRTIMQGGAEVQQEMGPNGWTTIGGGPRFAPQQAPQLGIYTGNFVDPKNPDAAPVFTTNKDALARGLIEQPKAPSDSTAVGLFKSYEQESKDFDKAKLAYQNVEKLASQKNTTATSDMALIMSVARLENPGSIVRAETFRNVAKAGSLGDRAQRAVQILDRGQTLTPQLRQEYIQTARALMSNHVGSQRERQDSYRKQAQFLGVDPDRIAPDRLGSLGSLDQESQPITTGDPQVDALLRKHGL